MTNQETNDNLNPLTLNTLRSELVRRIIEVDEQEDGLVKDKMVKFLVEAR